MRILSESSLYLTSWFVKLELASSQILKSVSIAKCIYYSYFLTQEAYTFPNGKS